MLKKALVICLAFVLLASISIFAIKMSESNKIGKYEIYFLKSKENIDLQKTKLEDLILEKKPILTDRDIVKFYWEDQVVVIKDSKYVGMNGTSRYPATPFVVVVNGERIFSGMIMNPISSLMPYSPRIAPLIGTEYDFYLKDLGIVYSAFKFKWNPINSDLNKKIFDPRIHSVLSKLNKIVETKEAKNEKTNLLVRIVSFSEIKKTIKTDQVEWIGSAERLKELGIKDEMPNGFYIHNGTINYKTYSITEETSCYSVNGGSQIYIEQQDFWKRLKEDIRIGDNLYNLVFINNEIVEVAKQYLP